MNGTPPPPEIPLPPAPPLGAEAPPPKRRRVAMWIGIAAAVVVVAVATGALLVSNRSSFRFPDSVAGYPRITSPAFQGLSEGIAKQATFGSAKPKIAIYGSETQPKLIVFFYDLAVSEPIDSIFRGFASGFTQSGGDIDVGAAVKETRGRATYECAPYTVSGARGTTCLWNDERSLGVVMTFDPTVSAMDITTQVHDILFD